MSPAIFAQGTGRVWWIALEAVIAKASFIEVRSMAPRRASIPLRRLQNE